MTPEPDQSAPLPGARPVPSPYLVPFDGTFQISSAPTEPPEDAPGKSECGKRLKRLIRRMREHQRQLYASDRFALLCVFQALDAAGKDSTIRAVTRGINPAGFQVFSFKQPSREELDHDFLWRTAKCTPERGRVGIFNRSYYEEVLVVRVHPSYLEGQRLPSTDDLDALWQERFESIREHERHLSRSGTVVLKFWLNVSKEEQRQRFLARIDEPEKNWKFSMGDVHERNHWDSYMEAYEAALNATSRPFAPWYAIPADSKPFMRLQVAEIIEGALTQLGLEYPQLDGEAKSELQAMRDVLEREE